MKKTILTFGLIALLIITSFADANFLKIKNYKVNLKPESPYIFSDKTTLKVGYSYNFIIRTNDPETDKVQYQFDWDANEVHDYSEWSGLYPSDQPVSFSHSWYEPGQYIVKVQAQDEHGDISSWSDGLIINVNYENQRRNIMLTGFWQPTSQMVARFSTNPFVNPDGWQGENWENLGFDIYSFVAKEYYNNQGTWEWKYEQITNEFWSIANQLHPIAIIGFGQGAKKNTWNIENRAINWIIWYPDEEGKQPSPNPPDDTVLPGFVRLSSLPICDIEKAVNNKTTIDAKINFLGTPGLYFCGYLAYLQLWYKAEHSNKDDEFLCKAAGWIHVNKSIALLDCIEATNITIRKTVEKVKKNVIVDEIKIDVLSSNKNINNYYQTDQQNIYFNQEKSNLLLFQNLRKNKNIN